MYRKISAILLSALIAVAILVYMLYPIASEIPGIIGQADLRFLAIAIGFCLLAWFVRGVRYRWILAGLGVEISLLFSIANIFISQTANLIVPARIGDLVRIFILKHEQKASYATGLSSLLIERVFDIVMVALLGLITLPFVVSVPDWFYTAIGIPLIAGAIFFIALLFLGKVQSQNRYIRMLLDMLEQVKEVSMNGRAFFAFAASSVIIWLLDGLVCAAVILMFHESVPFVVVTLAIVVGNLVKAVPITPGGIGTYELALAEVFQRIGGVTVEMSNLIAVVDHEIVKNGVTLVGGIASIYYFGDWVISVVKMGVTGRLRKE
jgi:uncharacterized protein (TIRG00374 family)